LSWGNVKIQVINKKKIRSKGTMEKRKHKHSIFFCSRSRQRNLSIKLGLPVTKGKKSLVERSNFSKIFSNNPLKIAVELLTAARKEYSDLDIQQEIDLRLTIIRTQAANLQLI
jgi:hypothetical protein